MFLGSAFTSDPIASKENTASAFGLEITGVKPKKTVTINDPATSRNRGNELRRTNSDSPDLTAATNGKIINFFLIIILLF